MLAFFDDAGFVLGGYVITFLTVGVFGWRVTQRGRTLGKQLPDDDKYWT